MTKNNTLFIGGTHGDEPIGVEVLRRLEQTRTDFDWIIGNPKALAQNTRCFEGDLNRSAPGNASSPMYEERRAKEILDLSLQYDITIDIHGASNATGIFIIITNPTEKNIALAAALPIENIVIWPSISPELAGPLSEYFPCGLEIECGDKNDTNIHDELYNILNNFLNTDNSFSEWKKEIENKKIYLVYDVLKNEKDIDTKNWKEFSEVTCNNETFFPLLINTYKNINDVLCYKMKRQVLQDVSSLLIKN